MERDHGGSLVPQIAETRATVGHLASDVAEMRKEFRGIFEASTTAFSN
jgi:hypothetical protein